MVDGRGGFLRLEETYLRGSVLSSTGSRTEWALTRDRQNRSFYTGGLEERTVRWVLYSEV
jgi:hypothetical protein